MLVAAITTLSILYLAAGFVWGVLRVNAIHCIPSVAPLAILFYVIAWPLFLFVDDGLGNG